MRKPLVAFAIVLASLGGMKALAQSDASETELFKVGTDGFAYTGLPWRARMISPFGERPVISPDGKKVAFIEKSLGEAYEYDIATGKVRNLTAHAVHKGFYRVHYLRDGSYVLTGVRRLAATGRETRRYNTELFWLDAAATGPIVPLGQSVFEGIAVSRDSNLISWAANAPLKTAPLARGNEGTSLLKVGEVTVKGGKAVLANVRTVASTKWSDCVMEAQDFLPRDEAIAIPCYVQGKAPDGADYKTLVRTVRLSDGGVTNHPLPNGEHGEVEGLIPGTKLIFVGGECNGICLLDLTLGAQTYKRITGPSRYGYGDPTVSPDGRLMALQFSFKGDDRGTGERLPGSADGIMLMDLPEKY